MKEGQEEQGEFAAWVNKKEKIVTFQSNEDKLIYVYHLCESGYRIF